MTNQENPPTQSASFASQPEAEAWAAKMRAEGMVRVRVAPNWRGAFWVYWRAPSKPEGNRTAPEVMLDWSVSRNRRRARVAREYWDAYESGRPMSSDDY